VTDADGGSDPAIRAVAALDDELRRGMYTFIRHARHPVSRDEAAASVGISRKLAAFHLDKLVDAGVLRARYEQAAGIRKVGRAPKVYEPTETDIQVSIPQRQHDMLADILLAAVAAEPAENARDAAIRIAHDRGWETGATERHRTRPGRLGVERALTMAGDVLARHGFEPTRPHATCVRLRNCPFHPLTANAPDVVCGLNHAFVTGLVEGLAATGVEAVLDPRAGECCVELRASRKPDRVSRPSDAAG
jgi:predicted ArsR family transcriptional regulator